MRELAGEAAADRLRVALLAWHVADLSADLAPVRRPLGPLLDGPPALEGPALAQAWEQVFNRQLTWRLVAVREPPSPFDAEPDAWQPGRPGTWSRTGPNAVRLLALLELSNTGATPLPLGRFGLDLHAGADTWSLSCELPRPGEDVLLRPLGRQTFNCVTVVPPAATALFDGSWDGVGAAAPRLRPRHFDRPEGVAALTAAIGSAHRPVNVLQIRQDAGRAAERVSARASAALVRRTEIDVSGLKLAAILVAFTVPLFLFGRRLQARGVSARVVMLAMLVPPALLGLALAAVLFAGLRGDRASFAPLVVPAAAFGYACASGIVAVLLLWLFALLDAEERHWHHTIVDAVRRTFDVTGSSSRAQFWGYFTFFVAGLYVATRLPYWGDRITTVALMAPLLTLTWRRWWSMQAVERSIVLGAVLLFILEVILDSD